MVKIHHTRMLTVPANNTGSTKERDSFLFNKPTSFNDSCFYILSSVGICSLLYCHRIYFFDFCSGLAGIIPLQYSITLSTNLMPVGVLCFVSYNTYSHYA